MKQFFICKLKHRKMVGEKEKVVTEPFLIEAYTWTEAESRVYQHAEMLGINEFTITSIDKSKFTDVPETIDFDLFYSCKIAYISVDQVNGSEKKITELILINADSVDAANDQLKMMINSFDVDCEIKQIKEYDLTDVICYEPIKSAENE